MCRVLLSLSVRHYDRDIRPSCGPLQRGQQVEHRSTLLGNTTSRNIWTDQVLQHMLAGCLG
jgi:hypothetical protein